MEAKKVGLGMVVILTAFTSIMYITRAGTPHDVVNPKSEILHQIPFKELPTKNPLPEIAIARRVWHKYPNKFRDLPLPLLISQPMGRLGNVMGEYATLYGLGRVYGVTTRLHPSMDNQLKNIFPGLTIPLLPGPLNESEWTRISYVTFINYGTAEAAASGIMGPHPFLLTGYPFEIQLFNTFRQDILKEFTFSEAIQNQVKSFWNKTLKEFSRVLIGFHVRRTDYVNFIKQFKALVPEDSYYERAVKYYRNKFSNPIFLIASDDRKYIREMFANYSDVKFTPDGSTRELDMALLSSCNHSIMTLGSFGFWSSYLAGGEVVYPDIKPTDLYTFRRGWYEFGHLDFFTPLPPN